MIGRLIGIVFVAVACGSAVASDPVPLPKHVPPVVGMGVVSDPGKDDRLGEWKIGLTVPKITWEVVGEMIPKRQWPQLNAEVEKSTLTLWMGGPSQLSPSRIVDVKGNELSRDQVLKRFEKETPVLISVSGRMPDAYFLQLTKPDALIVILGPRDGYPDPGLLPAKKRASKKFDKRGDR